MRDNRWAMRAICLIAGLCVMGCRESAEPESSPAPMTQAQSEKSMHPLTEDLMYVLEPARRYGDRRVLNQDLQDELVASLKADDLARLAEVHSRIVSQGDQSKISIAVFRSEYRRHPDSNRIIDFLHLLTLLHERGVRPFSDHLVQFDPTFPEPEDPFTLLPEELRYLREVVAAFGDLRSINDMYDVVESPTAEQRRVARRWGDQVKRDSEKIASLYEKYPSAQYPTMRRIMWSVGAVTEIEDARLKRGGN